MPIGLAEFDFDKMTKIFQKNATSGKLNLQESNIPDTEASTLSHIQMPYVASAADHF